MDALVTTFGSGVLSGATSAGAGPVGQVVYYLVGIGLFITIALIVMYLIRVGSKWAKN